MPARLDDEEAELPDPREVLRRALPEQVLPPAPSFDVGFLIADMPGATPDEADVAGWAFALWDGPRDHGPLLAARLIAEEMLHDRAVVDAREVQDRAAFMAEPYQERCRQYCWPLRCVDCGAPRGRTLGTPPVGCETCSPPLAVDDPDGPE